MRGLQRLRVTRLMLFLGSTLSRNALCVKFEGSWLHEIQLSLESNAKLASSSPELMPNETPNYYAPLKSPSGSDDGGYWYLRPCYIPPVRLLCS